MAGPSGQRIRQPAVAGMFYPADPNQCRALARQYTLASQTEQTTRWFGGVVPHAGWICSAAIAGQTIAALGQGSGVDLVVVFGAIHVPIPTHLAALDSFARWDLPGDFCEVQHDLRSRISEARALFCVDDRFHQREHAIEVELPLIRGVWPEAGLLPIQVPPLEQAVEIGRAVARAVSQAKMTAVYLASSDLTHYGSAYGFAPVGVDEAAMNWALDNDRKLIDQVLKMRAESIVPEVRAHQNACGAGAIAAMLAACTEMGANQARLLRHANSYQTLAGVAPQRPDNAVGYASIVIG